MFAANARGKSQRLSLILVFEDVVSVGIADQYAGSNFTPADPETERDPPEAATPIAFPIDCLPDGYQPSDWTTDKPPPDFRSLYATIKGPSQISDEHLTSLNLEILPPRSCQELVPQSYYPTLTTSDVSAVPSLTEAAVSKDQKAFIDRLKELEVDNETAYAIVTMNTKPGEKYPRLAYLRKFWTGLENMSQYWDTSRDQYYEVERAERYAVSCSPTNIA